MIKFWLKTWERKSVWRKKCRRNFLLKSSRGVDLSDFSINSGSWFYTGIILHNVADDNDLSSWFLLVYHRTCNVRTVDIIRLHILVHEYIKIPLFPRTRNVINIKMTCKMHSIFRHIGFRGFWVAGVTLKGHSRLSEWQGSVHDFLLITAVLPSVNSET